MDNNPGKLKKRIVEAIIVLVLLVGLYLIYTTSFIEISVSNAKAGGSLKYELLSQKKSKTKNITSDSTSIKLRVTRGGYEIHANQDGASYFAVVKASGFFRKTNVTASLVPEKSRQFVGNNPSACMQYKDSLLISYSCGDLYKNILTHTPATSQTATYTTTNTKSFVPGYIEGLITTKEGSLGIIHSVDQENPSASHLVYDTTNIASPTALTQLSDLSSEITYSIQPYKDGFLAYNNSFNHTYYYSSIKSKPQAISLPKAKTVGLSGVSLNVSGGNIIAVFSTSLDADNKHANSEIMIKSDSVKDFKFSKAYSRALICGTDRLCAFDSKHMDVYNVAGSKPKLLFVLNDVMDIQNTSRGFLAINKSGVLNFNLDTQAGFYEYSFGDYRFNNFQSAEGGYVLALTNSNANKVAIYIKQTSDNTDSIDKKVELLQKLQGVTLVSDYGKYIYVSADLGDLVYNSSLKSYTYNPAAMAAASKSINAEIDKLGINRNVYVVSSNAF